MPVSTSPRRSRAPLQRALASLACISVVMLMHIARSQHMHTFACVRQLAGVTACMDQCLTVEHGGTEAHDVMPVSNILPCVGFATSVRAPIRPVHLKAELCASTGSNIRKAIEDETSLCTAILQA